MEAVSRRFGRLDALVNNAGVAVFAPLLETSDQDWNRVLAVNLTGPFLCAKAAAPLMREHGGGAIREYHVRISAVRASTLRSAYGTSKAGLAHLTKQLAVELASLGIRVNGVAPGARSRPRWPKAVHTRRSAPIYHDAIPAQPLRAGRGIGRGGVLSMQRALKLHHRADPSRSMAASTPPASDCRTLRGERRNG